MTGDIRSDEGDDVFNNLYAGSCGYFDGRTSYETIYRIPSPREAADTVMHGNAQERAEADPAFCQQMLFDIILAEGFRRSGTYVYRADCPDCKACIPIRISPGAFEPSKSQRRVFERNRDLAVTITSNADAFVTDEKVSLFRAYDRRHNPDAEKSFDEAKRMLTDMNGICRTADNTRCESFYSGTMNMNYTCGGTLVGVGIIDAGAASLSSNYFYYDTSDETKKRSIGTYSILREIELCRKFHLQRYYLGYWLKDCKSMVYKSNFKPHELLIGGEWKIIT